MLNRKFAAAVLVTAALLSGFASPAGAAPAPVTTAGVIVPPGESGSTCSGYFYVQTNPNLYWQTCAWADNNEVYFTVNFGNASTAAWVVDTVLLDYYKSGVKKICTAGVWTNFTVPAKSTKSTPTATCAIPRTSAAYAAIGQVADLNFNEVHSSPTLQVQ